MQTLEIIPVVMILTGLIKSFIPSEYVAPIAVLLGLALALATAQDVTSVLNGILAGLGAIGTYNMSKGKEKSEIEVLQGLIK